MNIIELKGDVLQSKANLICHQCNTLGIMGGGLALQVKRQAPSVFDEYKKLCDEHKENTSELMGCVQYCRFNEDSEIANVFGQNDVGYGERMTDYDALKKAFADIREYAKSHKISTIAIPKYFGCGLAGGDWGVVLPIIRDSLYSLDGTLMIVDFNN